MYNTDSYKEIVVCAVILLILDAIYISTMSTFYSKQIVNIQHEKIQVKPLGVIICYLFIIFGLYYFIISKKLRSVDAFLFGAIIYGVYDATNYATLKNWSPYLAMIDIIWGGMLFLITTELTYFITKKT